jgi:hypothetical protein
MNEIQEGRPFNSAELKRQWLVSFSLVGALVPLVLCCFAMAVAYAPTRQVSYAQTAFKGLFWPGYFFLVLAAGTKAITGSISHEVHAGTWIMQRMTALTAWDMWIGKYFGSCAPCFLAAGWLLLGYAWADGGAEEGLYIRGVLLLLFTAVVYLLAMVAAGTRILYSSPSGFWESMILSVLAFLACKVFGTLPTHIMWYGFYVQSHKAVFLLLLFAGFWGVIGCQRVFMKLLDYRVSALGWILFLLSAWVVLAGFRGELFPLWQSERVWLGFVLFYASAYCCGIVTPDFLRYRSLLQSVRDRNLNEIYYRCPIWIPCFVGALAISFVASAVPSNSNYFYRVAVGHGLTTSFSMLPVAFCLYCFRDIAVIMFLHWGFSKRPKPLVLVYLMFCYAVAPVVFGAKGIVVLFMPSADASVVVQLLIPLIEIAVTSFFLKQAFIKHIDNTVSDDSH